MENGQVEQTMMVEKDVNPIWNQQVLLHNPKDQIDHSKGFFFIQIRDFHKNEPIDTLVIPMIEIRPFQTYHFCINSSHIGNPAEVYKVNTSFVLETPFLGQEDKVAAVVLNSTKFSPAPDASFQMVLSLDQKQAQQIYFPISPRDEAGDYSRVKSLMSFIQNQKIFMAPWMNIPPVRTNN